MVQGIVCCPLIAGLVQLVDNSTKYGLSKRFTEQGKLQSCTLDARVKCGIRIEYSFIHLECEGGTKDFTMT